MLERDVYRRLVMLDVLLSIFSVSPLLFAGVQAPKAEPLRLIQTIPLPGVEGRIDHLACDEKRQRLFIAALGNNSVEVVDLERGARLESIAGMKEPQGIAYLPSTDQTYVANGQGVGLEIVDAGSFRRLGAAPIGEDSDNVRRLGEDRVIVGYGSGALAVVGRGGKVIGRISLPGHPESFQISKSGKIAYVNVPAAQRVFVCTLDSGKVVTSWEVKDARANFPMALDEAHHRLFVGCRDPAVVIEYDTGTGKEVGRMSIVGDTDDLFLDESLNRLYVIGGGGAVNVFRQDNPDHYSPLATIQTAPGARTGYFVQGFHKLYVAVPKRGAQQAEIRVYETRP
jgi:hypothetical protein